MPYMDQDYLKQWRELQMEELNAVVQADAHLDYALTDILALELDVFTREEGMVA